MFRTFNVICLLILLSNVLVFAEKPNDKAEKLTKPSEFKQKLSKEHILTEHKQDVKETLKTDGPDTEDMTDLGITVPPEYSNYTVEVSNHVFYNAFFHSDPEMGTKYWVNLTAIPHNVTTHIMLSNSHRQATAVDLTFGFPFYGSIMHNVTIATGGFLYMGDYLHNWIAATQYVAPLMANFDTRQSPKSEIKYADNGTAFIVEWDNVALQDKIDEGTFTFQVSLLKNGDIIFAYKDVPHTVKEISDDRHPVKIGISDAYILERSLFFVKRKTIYEYHRIDFLKKNIANNTAVYFVALPTCASFKNCSSCVEASADMECNWCDTVKRCSDGIDRQRQNWIAHNCVNNYSLACSIADIPSAVDHSHVVPRKGAEIYSKDTELTTGQSAKSSTYKDSSSSIYNVDTEQEKSGQSPDHYSHFVQESYESSGRMSVGAIVTLVVFLVALVSAGTWVMYAYKFPQSSSGQFLIKYRPSQWALGKDSGSTETANSRHF